MRWQFVEYLDYAIRNLAELKPRKGMDKPIFIIVSLTLALMFLAVIFTATSGQFNNSLNSFLGGMSNVSKG
jgi:hypothetical protein